MELFLGCAVVLLQMLRMFFILDTHSLLIRFVYRLVTSAATNFKVDGTEPNFSISSKKWLVSLKYDFNLLIIGLMKKSATSDIRSVGQSLAETIGLPGGFAMFLCIFGSK